MQDAREGLRSLQYGCSQDHCFVHNTSRGATAEPEAAGSRPHGDRLASLRHVRPEHRQSVGVDPGAAVPIWRRFQQPERGEEPQPVNQQSDFVPGYFENTQRKINACIIWSHAATRVMFLL